MSDLPPSCAGQEHCCRARVTNFVVFVCIYKCLGFLGFLHRHRSSTWIKPPKTRENAVLFDDRREVARRVLAHRAFHDGINGWMILKTSQAHDGYDVFRSRGRAEEDQDFFWISTGNRRTRFAAPNTF